MILLCSNSIVLALNGHPIQSTQALIKKAEEFNRKGDFKHAALTWKKVLEKLNLKNDADLVLNANINLANAYKNLGMHQKAISVFQDTESIAENNRGTVQTVLFYNAGSDLFSSLGMRDQSVKYLKKAANDALKLEDPYLTVKILVNMSLNFSSFGFFQDAIEGYDICLKIIDQAKNSTAAQQLRPKVMIGLARVKLKWDKYSEDEVISALDNAKKEIDHMQDCHDKAGFLISISVLAKETKMIFPGSGNYLKKLCFNGLTDANRIAEKLSNNRLISYSAGELANVYEMEKDDQSAIKLTRKAIFFASDSNKDLLYRWQWQLGRLFKATDQAELAIQSYSNAIATLNPIRNEITRGHRNNRDIFHQKIKPVYLEFAELLIEQAEFIAPNNSLRQNTLQEAINVMELLKKAELENYFEDECVTKTKIDSNVMYTVPDNTAILYSISLPRQLILLVIVSDGMKVVKVPVNSDTLEKSALQYRKHLQIRAENLFLSSGQKLYQWLIHPVKPLLVDFKIDTLIIASDGALRLIPFSTLFDGNKFLIESYAIGTISSLELTDMKPSERKPVTPQDDIILLGGLSEARMDHIPLPNVKTELLNIKKIMNGKILLLNKDFTMDNLSQAFQNKTYPIVHLATHGVFGGSSSTSYLLTYNNMIDMKQLEGLIKMGQFRRKQMELLTFSACQTAMGNDSAALGLAGVAVKAGARSVVGTLWYVDDEATATILKEFYTHIQKADISKVKALQYSQIKLVNDLYYWHPNYWGPFVLIGNWL
jgi:CHAT domain-containing protein